MIASITCNHPTTIAAITIIANSCQNPSGLAIHLVIKYNHVGINAPAQMIMVAMVLAINETTIPLLKKDLSP